MGNLGKLRNEGYGQGESRTTAVGVAGMLARLAAASQGTRALRLPHLVEQINDAAGKTIATAATRSVPGQAALAGSIAIPVQQAVAQKVLAGMAQGSYAGTSRDTCMMVFGRGPCMEGRMRFAGKTGTTSFYFDETTLDNIVKANNSHSEWNEASMQRPMKWYVAAYDARGVVGNVGRTLQYDKVIAVLTERNWYGRKSSFPNRIHGLKSDDAVNISAEIGMQVMKRIAGSGNVQ